MKGTIRKRNFIRLIVRISGRLVASAAIPSERRRAACKKELRRGFIHPFCERQISNVDFSGSPAASGMSRSRVTHTPRPGEVVNLVLVLGILCLAIDGVDLH